MSLQIPVEGVALAAHRAKRLQPPAIPGMAQLGNIKRAWTDRAPEGYKRLLDTTRKRLQAFDESLGIEPFAFSGDEESASADESEGDPTSTPFPYSPSKSDAFYRSPSKKDIIEVTSTDDDSPSIAPAKRRATCDIKGKGKASSNASPAKSRAKRLRKSDEERIQKKIASAKRLKL
ncbi:hypothetical protein ACEPAG_7493 [Sanghuangporus baumii]